MGKAGRPFLVKTMHLPGFLALDSQQKLLSEIKEALKTSPFYIPTLRTGKTMNLQMTNFGHWGWMADTYTYSKIHPGTGKPWAGIPSFGITIIDALIYHNQLPKDFLPEGCICNLYKPGNRLGLHQDKDEENLDAPIISISLGCTGIFELGGMQRRDPVEHIDLNSGDAYIMAGNDRLRFHGLAGIKPGTNPLGDKDWRIVLTVRQVHH